MYEWLLVRYAGGSERLSLREIAEKWHVHISRVYQDKERIIRLIREAVGK